MAAIVEGLDPLPAHPMSFLLRVRDDANFDPDTLDDLDSGLSAAAPEDFSLTHSIQEPETVPFRYCDRVRLVDVVGFRMETQKRALLAKKKLFRRGIEAKKKIEKALKECMELCPPVDPTPAETNENEKEKFPPHVRVFTERLPIGCVPQFDPAHYDFCRSTIYKSCTSANQYLVDDLQAYCGMAKDHGNWHIAIKTKMDKLREHCLPRRVQYRVIADMDLLDDGVQRPINKAWNYDCFLLEACHFETYLPDRLDLRYICLHPELPRPDPPLIIGQVMLVSVLDIAMLHKPSKKTKFDGRMSYPLVWGLVKMGEIVQFSFGNDIKRRKVYVCEVATDRDAFTEQHQPLKGTKYALVEGFTFPIFFRDDRDWLGRLFYANMTYEEASWPVPCEKVVSLDAYARLTRLVKSSMPFHSICIDFNSLEERREKEIEVLDADSDDTIVQFEKRRAFEMICEESDNLFSEGLTYWEMNARMIKLEDQRDQHLIKTSTFPNNNEYAYLLVSFPPWITTYKFPLFIQSEGQKDDYYLFLTKKCPVLTELWEKKKLGSAFDIRIYPCQYPIPIMSALMGDKDDYRRLRFVGVDERSRESLYALFGKERSYDMDIVLPSIDDTVFKKLPRLFRDIVVKKDGEQSLGDQVGNQQAVRIGIVSDEPLIILGEKQMGKTSGAIAIAMSKPTLTLVMAKTRADCRKLLEALEKMDPGFSPLATPQDDWQRSEKEEECCEFFVWARIDIVITTPLTLALRTYYGSSAEFARTPFLDPATIIIDNAHNVTDDMAYLILKHQPHDQLILIGNHQEECMDSRESNILRTALCQENLYVSRLVRPSLPQSTREFFYPISKYSASESLARYCIDKEFPALCDVLQLFKEAKVPYKQNAIPVATCKAHAKILHQPIENLNELNYAIMYPEEFEGVITSIVIIFGGRRADHLWRDKKFRRYIESSHLDILVAIGSSNPFGFPHLTDASQLAFKDEFFSLYDDEESS